MSWHYFPEPEAESSVVCCVDGEPWQPSKLKTTQGQFFCNGKLTESYLDSLSGMTSEPSMENLGEGELTSSPEVSRAKTSHAQVGVQGLTVIDPVSGLRCSESLGRYDRDTSSLRTHQCSLFEGSTELLQTLPRWGCLLDGECWELTMPEHLTEGNESGSLLPTPSASSYGTNQGGSAGRTGKESPSLQTMASKNMWPTPRVSDTEGAPIKNAELINGSWSRKNAKGERFGIKLKDAVHATQKMWPTPRASEYKGTGPKGSKSQIHMLEKHYLCAVVEEVDGGLSTRQNYPTPTATDAIKGGNVSPRPGAMGLSERTGGHLNPDWVEWLMGWCIEWTDLKPLAMGRFRQWLKLHGKL